MVTDHGACRILEEEKRSFDSAIVKKLFPDEKYRFFSRKQEQADEISPNLWKSDTGLSNHFSLRIWSILYPRVIILFAKLLL